MSSSVIVTGASRGIGAAAARCLGKCSASVTLVARTMDSLLQVAEDVKKAGGKPLVIGGDITDPDVCQHVVSETLRRCGRVDALINNAGELRPIAPIGNTDIMDWHYNFEINLMAPFYLVNAALPALRESKGRVINVSSGAAEKAIETWAAYCASKAALTHFTRILDAEEPKVTAIAFRPGVVDTEMQTVIRKEGRGNMPAASYAYFQQLKDTGQLTDPMVPAKSLAWLALEAPSGWGGEFMNYDDSRVMGAALAYFN